MRVITDGHGAVGDELRSTKLLDVEEFNEFVERLQLTDSFFTQRDARLTFLRSRMLVIDESCLKGRRGVLHVSSVS